MKDYFKVMMIQPNGFPMNADNKHFGTEEEAEKHMEKLKGIYNAPMLVSHVYDNRK
jgi:hypothetical protein